MIVNGNIYHYDLNKERTELKFPVNSPLYDKVIESNETRFNDETLSAEGFGCITDIEIGRTDGYLYILAYHEQEGSICRIIPTSDKFSVHPSS